MHIEPHPVAILQLRAIFSGDQLGEPHPIGGRTGCSIMHHQIAIAINIEHDGPLGWHGRRLAAAIAGHLRIHLHPNIGGSFLFETIGKGGIRRDDSRLGSFVNNGILNHNAIIGTIPAIDAIDQRRIQRISFKIIAPGGIRQVGDRVGAG